MGPAKNDSLTKFIAERQDMKNMPSFRLASRRREEGFWVFELPDGRHVEVFSSMYPGKGHFDTGPVVGFAVEDLPSAVRELRDAGIELLGTPGPTWQHFRGPDGNVYELVAD
jgi:hypothetical protein